MSGERTKVFVVDDHAGMRKAIAAYLAKEFDVVGLAATAEEALASTNFGDATVAIVDVSLPRTNGIDLVGTLLARWPHLRCLMLSGHDSVSYVRGAFAAGARGYLRKEDTAELSDAIRCVAGGDVFLCEHFRALLPGGEGADLIDDRGGEPR